jgi:hypothetical protein
LFGLRGFAEIARFEILEDNHFIGIDQLPGLFMKKVFALISDFPMALSNTLNGFPSPMASSLLSRYGLLCEYCQFGTMFYGNNTTHDYTLLPALARQSFPLHRLPCPPKHATLPTSLLY